MAQKREGKLEQDEMKQMLAEMKASNEKLSAELAAVKASIPNTANIIETVEGQLAPKIIESIKAVAEQIPGIVQQQTETTLKANIDQIKEGVASAIAKAGEDQVEPAKVAPVGGVNWFDIGKGAAAGIGENIKGFQPIIDLIISIVRPKQQDMGAMIDIYTKLSRYEKAGGDINALKSIVTGQPNP